MSTFSGSLAVGVPGVGWRVALRVSHASDSTHVLVQIRLDTCARLVRFGQRGLRSPAVRALGDVFGSHFEIEYKADR